MRPVIAFAVMLSLCGCGGGSKFDPPCTSQPFDNHTLVGREGADADQLWQDWRYAQNELSTKPIAINPVTSPDNIEYRPADPRSSRVEPQCVAVYVIPDLTTAQLQAENPGKQLQHATDPTGVIHCPQGSRAIYCYAYTGRDLNSVYVAASLVYATEYIGYEMENIILSKLGYNVSGR